MFAGRAAVSGPSAVKGGKFTVEELYGFTKKPKPNTRGGAGGSTGPVEDHREWKQRQKDRQKEDSAFASQVLEAARRLMERRRLELYLNECQLSLKDCPAEHSPMGYRYLGKSGLRVSCLGLGTWVTFGSQISDEVAECILTTAYNNGVNLFDTAEVYASGRRSTYVVTTKIYWGGPAETERGLSRKHIIEGLRASLNRLQLDYVDIVFANRNDINSPMEEVVRAMTFVIEQGMAMYWGTSRWNVVEIMEAYAVARQFNLIAPVCEQSEYHYFQRDKIERQLPDLYHKIGVGVMSWSPLACGLLTGKYNDGIPEGSRAAMKGYSWLKDRVCSDEWKKQLSKIKDLRLIAESLNCTPAQLAIAWCLRSEGVSTVLLGATNSEQLLENVGSIKVLSQLTPPIIAEMDTLLGNKPRSNKKDLRS